MTVDLGVVILAYGPQSQELVNRLVEDLIMQDVDPDRVTVVINPDGSRADFCAADPRITIIRPERNLGYAGGMNLGINHQLESNTRLVLLVTMDARLDRRAVEQLCKAAEHAPRFGLLGPVLRWGGTDDHISWGVRWNSTGEVAHILSPPDKADESGIIACDSLDGAVLLVRSEMIREIGPLAERLFMYFEETELCLRAQRAGWHVGIVLGAVAQQASGQHNRPGAFNYLMARNGLHFADLVAGRRGVAAGLLRSAVRSWRLLKMRFSPRSDRARQQYALASLTGLWLGVIAYFGNRWGPPPPDLPGLGDVSFVG